ncbi:alpha/beta fold hydrolase [Streptomyces sp. SID8352]|uniref:alpha/beta fold hydrolase n=1 Tax=Streptomyces sp. SID8352 TaxID=2690338 RepID=UPI0013713E35|nr:alpha/beta fold hydrolase [Streptomyces sp. SID8352]MYU24116.1 alpha/beta fold hydrolase [Streptomyces sp. SID8352]
MSTGEEGVLLVAFPAAGSGGTTLEQLEKLAARQGMDFLSLPNPPTSDAVESGQWQRQCLTDLVRTLDGTGATLTLLVGHCMGGFSALRLRGLFAEHTGHPTGVLLINTPCPDGEGRIPTMSELPDDGIARILAHEGFPQDLLDDEDVLAEVADRLRSEASVADGLARWLRTEDEPLDLLHVLSTRGDFFIPPRHCVTWHERVRGEVHLTVADGGHAIDASLAGLLEKCVHAALAGTRTENA